MVQGPGKRLNTLLKHYGTGADTETLWVGAGSLSFCGPLPTKSAGGRLPKLSKLSLSFCRFSGFLVVFCGFPVLFPTFPALD
jgi:hypothetical protein